MEKQYKRTSRSVPQDVRTKISAALKNRPKNDIVRQKISDGMKKYWGDDKNFPDDGQRHEGTGNGWLESGDIV